MRSKLLFLLFLGSLAFGQQTDSTQIKDPVKAAHWALVCPGAGQIYNGKYLKAGLIFTSEILAIWRFDVNRKNYRNFSETMSLPQHRYLEKRNKYAWWVGFIYIYGLLDAVVDAHLSTFDRVMDQPIDKKLPESEKDREKDQ